MMPDISHYPYGSLSTAQAEHLRRELARFTYKPGWTFDYDLDRMMVTVHFLAPDSRGSDRTAAVTSRQTLPPYLIELDTKEIARWLVGLIRDMEHHETMEWFRLDGELYDDPHKRGPRT